MQQENDEWVQEQISSEFQDPAIKDINDEVNQNFEHMKFILIDKIMFEAYLDIDDKNYKDDYKIIAQNNFSKEILKFAKIAFFNKYFDTKLFSDDYINYFNRYDDPYNVTITPEMAESVERLGKNENYKEYLKK